MMENKRGTKKIMLLNLIGPKKSHDLLSSWLADYDTWSCQTIASTSGGNTLTGYC